MISDSDKLQEIITIDSDLNKIQDQDILLERILQVARRLVNAEAGSIYIVNDGKLEISYSQNDSLQAKLPEGQKLIYNIFKIPINKKTISGYCAKTRRIVNIEDVYSIPESAPYTFDPFYDKVSEYHSQSMLAVPMLSNMGNLLGVLQVINKRAGSEGYEPFTREDELLINHFANNVVITLERAQMTRALLLRMIQMAELRDPKETGAHVNRVAGYSVEIYERWASKKGIPDHKIQKDRDNLRMAAMLHDAGKVAISDIILKKPARFTPEEYKIMQHHTIFGAKLFLDEQSEFDKLARLVALTHHENWDGTGYPGYINLETGLPEKTDADGQVLGRKGKEIPIFGRIVAIADVYDALRSKRSYKEAWKEEDVLEELRSLSGSKFDPEVVECFFEVYPQLQQVAQRYQDQEAQ
ncbi:HD domain-containing phosphohydrolase [Spirochaeta lutea]|uniref:Phosphohydrolase n=1 Tax=Spirochaeta lutea TaxID=1480694 RepID=A0A098QVU2_9SPIO|nr:HD domain-containing phosphohydrolase [Spirochaeta lutea]KGE71965.1 phosphohydrolase [Spirochaeta lutea]